MDIPKRLFPKKEEGPERGDLCRPTRREFRCLLCLGIWHRLLLGKAVANLGGGPHLLFGNIRPYERVHKQKNLITRSNGKKIWVERVHVTFLLNSYILW